MGHRALPACILNRKKFVTKKTSKNKREQYKIPTDNHLKSIICMLIRWRVRAHIGYSNPSPDIPEKVKQSALICMSNINCIYLEVKCLLIAALN